MKMEYGFKNLSGAALMYLCELQKINPRLAFIVFAECLDKPRDYNWHAGLSDYGHSVNKRRRK